MNNQQFQQWCVSKAYKVAHSMPLIMGILNVTPDSFSDGGRYRSLDQALTQARSMIDAGVDLIDIGGESTRPGALAVSLEEEMDRVLPVIEGLRAETDICLSIDTTKPLLMQAAVSAGAGLINDVSALTAPDALYYVKALKVPVCLMHRQGSSETMQHNPEYPRGVVTELNEFFSERVQTCLSYGLQKDQLLLDPGFGFGKTVAHNLQIIKYFDQFRCHELPLLLGLSRKTTLGELTNKPVDERLGAGLALTVLASLKGLSIIRTHDVEATKQALLMVKKTEESM